MTNLPTLRTKYGSPIGVELYFAFPEIQDEQKTFLDADVASGASSLSANGVNFSTSQYIVIGQPGALKTEIVQISGSPSSTSIALVGTTAFPHNRGDIIRFIPYNQITPEYSTNGTTFVALGSAISIRADSTETYLQDASGLSTYSYKFRFNNGSTFSAYSDSTPATGYADNTIGSVKRRALREMGEVLGDLVTDQDMNDWLQQGRRQMDQMPQVFRFTFRQKFNATIGQCISGAYSVAAPADLRDRNTYKNILGLRFGRQNRPCIYQDQVRFAQNFLNVAHTTLNGAVVFGATSITLTSTHDLDDSGSISVAGGAVGTLHTNLTYTTNNRTTNVLGGVTGVPAATTTATSATSPGTMEDDATNGTVAWTNPDDAKVSDSNYAYVSIGTSHYLKATNFGFAIPAGATITGILAEIQKFPAGNNYDVKDSEVKIIKSDGTIGTTNRANTTTKWPAGLAYYSYGSSSDLWGENWTVADINDIDFGIAISAIVGAGGGGQQYARIDHIRITVYYTLPISAYITGLDVWQNANFFGLPTAYTIDSGLIQFDVPFMDSLDGRNIIMDYYTTIPSITSDSQQFDEPFYEMYKSFLKYRIKDKKANGKIDRDSDSDYKDFQEGMAKVIAQETISQKINFVPDVEGFLSATQ